jgi:hypothetical protein
LADARTSVNPLSILSTVIALVLLAPVVAIVVGGAKVKGVVNCPAGKWTPVVKNVGTAFPRSIVVEIASDGEDVGGRWREVRQRRLFKDDSVAGDLEKSLVFHRRWIDWRYRIEVRPTTDVKITVT